MNAFAIDFGTQRESRQRLLLSLLKDRVSKVLRDGNLPDKTSIWGRTEEWSFEFAGHEDQELSYTFQKKLCIQTSWSDREGEIKSSEGEGKFEFVGTFRFISFEDNVVVGVREQKISLPAFYWDEKDRFCEYLRGWIRAIKWLAEKTKKNTNDTIGHLLPSDFHFPEVFSLKTPQTEDDFFEMFIKSNRLGVYDR